ncbi:ribonuclease H [Pullulanibacillus camelliae]|uniref:Ribonuclease H n=1 Tax=Pullulanibacillus camelliae TaxID=1707096 RepID=A0A8J2VMX6_9BACL|nr:ribonuclease H [Pullulanibacillus camelliae]
MIEVYIDGASAGNPGPSGIGILIKLERGQTEEIALPLGSTTNHHAEFQALITAMHICIDKHYQAISVRTDSQLVERAVEKEYVKNKSFQAYLDEVLKLKSHFSLFFIKWIPSAENKKADHLARSAIQKAIQQQKRRE